MLPRRRASNINPNHVSQQQAGGSVGGGREPDLVTNQVPPRGPTARTSVTVPPVSEAPPFDTPTPVNLPIPESRRRPIRRNTNESHNSTSEPAPPQPESGPAHRETAGVSEGIHAGVWPTYNKVSQEFDEKGLKQWNDDLDVLLIFVSVLARVRIRSDSTNNNLQAALFSAIVTAFLIKALDDLNPNYQKQSALLLHQLLNGRDPNLANISDPTILQRPTNSAIAVNCFWFASLLASLGASLCAIICKGWLTEYTSGPNPVVGLLRACRRHIRFMAFQQLNVHTLVSFLPVLLHSSVLLFFAGAVVYLLQMDKRVAIVFVTTGGIFGAVYFILAILPFMTNPPFRHCSTFLFYQPFVVIGIGKVVIPIVNMCYLALCYPFGAILWLLIRSALPNMEITYRDTVEYLSGDYNLIRAWWARTSHDPLDEIDTSQRIQEEAILWLSQVPLDPSESKALITSLALISSSRPYRFERPVIALLTSVLEASLREGGNKEQTSVAIDCVIVLGNIKFQSAVDRNSDCDHNVGGVPVPPSVAWAAQKLLADAPRANNGIPSFDGIRERLLAATAWLSPVEVGVLEREDGKNLRIQGRAEFVEEIDVAIKRHIDGENPPNTKALITLIRGAHAYIPRGDYGNDLFSDFSPLSFCGDHTSPLSEDEEVLRALITYTLDELVDRRRRPLVERNMKFRDLALELIDALKIDPYCFDAAWFGFWLMCRVPYAFESRRTIATDIDRIWGGSHEKMPEEHQDFHNLLAIRAFATAVRLVVDRVTLGYPWHTNLASLALPSAALELNLSRPTGIYAISMILHLGPLAEDSPPIGWASVKSVLGTLFPPGGGDIERNIVEEDVINLYIYSTLILLKLSPTPMLDDEKLLGLIARVGNAIEDPFIREAEAVERSEVEIHADLGRARWKAIYLSALLPKLLPDDQTEEHSERLRVRVWELLDSGVLSLAEDCHNCLEPLAMDVPELRDDQQKEGYAVFEAWFKEFPLLPLKEISGREPGREALREMSP